MLTHSIATEADLDGVKSGKLLGQVGQLVEALERSGRAAGLQDQPPLGHEQRTLAQDVGVHLEQDQNYVQP